MLRRRMKAPSDSCGSKLTQIIRFAESDSRVPALSMTALTPFCTGHEQSGGEETIQCFSADENKPGMFSAS